MRFLIDIEVQPEDGRGPIDPVDVERHLRDYVFHPMVVNELSLLEDDGDHERGSTEDYRTFRFSSASVGVAD